LQKQDPYSLEAMIERMESGTESWRDL
jgi:hypothetical protein